MALGDVARRVRLRPGTRRPTGPRGPERIHPRLGVGGFGTRRGRSAGSPSCPRRAPGDRGRRRARVPRPLRLGDRRVPRRLPLLHALGIPHHVAAAARGGAARLGGPARLLGPAVPSAAAGVVGDDRHRRGHGAGRRLEHRPAAGSARRRAVRPGRDHQLALHRPGPQLRGRPSRRRRRSSTSGAWRSSSSSTCCCRWSSPACWRWSGLRRAVGPVGGRRVLGRLVASAALNGYLARSNLGAGTSAPSAGCSSCWRGRCSPAPCSDGSGSGRPGCGDRRCAGGRRRSRGLVVFWNVATVRSTWMYPVGFLVVPACTVGLILGALQGGLVARVLAVRPPGRARTDLLRRVPAALADLPVAHARAGGVVRRTAVRAAHGGDADGVGPDVPLPGAAGRVGDSCRPDGNVSSPLPCWCCWSPPASSRWTSPPRPACSRPRRPPRRRLRPDR